MNIYIIEVHTFPHVMGNDKIIRVESEKDLDIILNEVKDKLKNKNPLYEYDLYAYTLENFINGIELFELED